MRVSVIVPERIMIVDGVARHIDMTGLETDLHAVQWEGAAGDLEYGKPTPRNVSITDLTPYQFLLDRWTAAAPPPPPPPPPPIDQSDIDNLEKRLKALALCIAEVGGLTALQMKTLFKQKWDALP